MTRKLKGITLSRYVFWSASIRYRLGRMTSRVRIDGGGGQGGGRPEGIRVFWWAAMRPKTGHAGLVQ